LTPSKRLLDYRRSSGGCVEDQNDIIAVTTFADALVRNATVDPDREFIVMPEGRRTCSSMLERGLEVARSLLGLGVEMRDRVGILMPNCLDFVELFFGASLVGAVPVPINARFKFARPPA
jgi:fatty-acyl-CoA synthase